MMITGYVGVTSPRRPPWHEIIAVFFGIGTGLRWTSSPSGWTSRTSTGREQGRKSIDAVIVAGDHQPGCPGRVHGLGRRRRPRSRTSSSPSWAPSGSSASRPRSMNCVEGEVRDCRRRVPDPAGRDRGGVPARPAGRRSWARLFYREREEGARRRRFHGHRRRPGARPSRSPRRSVGRRLRLRQPIRGRSRRLGGAGVSRRHLVPSSIRRRSWPRWGSPAARRGCPRAPRPTRIAMIATAGWTCTALS